MIKKLLLLSIFLCFTAIYAQYDDWTPAQIILKNGTTIRGVVKFPKHSGGLISIGTTEFKYRKNYKASTEHLNHETVEEVIFGDEEFATEHYKYVPIKENRYVLMELVVRGKASLFARTVLKSTSTPSVFTNMPSNVTFYDDTQLFLIRPYEPKAQLIAGPNSSGSFVSIAKKYFADCEKIVDYLEYNVYDLKDVVDLVKDYNLFCE